MNAITSGSQTVGPFFRYGLDRPEWSDVARGLPDAQRIHIAGSVLDGEDAPVPDALIEIWQANAEGRYAHPADLDAPGTSGFIGFGRACTDAEGHFSFVTIIPGSVPGPDGAPQAPHINASVFARGLLARLVTRIYFADLVAQNAADPVLRSIGDERARATLIAPRREGAAGGTIYDVSIVLQGPNETAFFDL
ncbi:MAG: protocatechuate 3,4-dioxygenase subunit alpha [Candidatus Velthaea sp.]